MPSIQKALPPELADNVLRLYRECLRRARFIGHQEFPAVSNDRERTLPPVALSAQILIQASPMDLKDGTFCLFSATLMNSSHYSLGPSHHSENSCG
ncbi:hypothetical protein ABZP36_034981 [Zizania latifolia]